MLCGMEATQPLVGAWHYLQVSFTATYFWPLQEFLLVHTTPFSLRRTWSRLSVCKRRQCSVLPWSLRFLWKALTAHVVYCEVPGHAVPSWTCPHVRALARQAFPTTVERPGVRPPKGWLVILPLTFTAPVLL